MKRPTGIEPSLNWSIAWLWESEIDLFICDHELLSPRKCTMYGWINSQKARRHVITHPAECWCLLAECQSSTCNLKSAAVSSDARWIDCDRCTPRCRIVELCCCNEVAESSDGGHWGVLLLPVSTRILRHSPFYLLCYCCSTGSQFDSCSWLLLGPGRTFFLKGSFFFFQRVRKKISGLSHGAKRVSLDLNVVRLVLETEL